MATYSHREIVSRRIEYTVPALPQWGACLGDMQAAIAAACIAYAKANPGAVVADDSLRFFPSDDEIVISFTVEQVVSLKTAARPAPQQRCDEMAHNGIGSETFCQLERDHDGDHDDMNGLEWPRED